MLAEKIESILTGRLDKKKSSDFYKRYHKEFCQSGVHKGETALNQLKSLPEVPSLDRLAYVSLGGSEGSEVDFVLRNSKVNYGILLELDSYACQLASERSKTLPKEKSLDVIQGNVVEKLPVLQEFLRELKDSGKIDGVLIVANAIFHELPYRAKGFNLGSFLKELFWDWDPCIFLCREPCKPFNWPEQIELSVDGISSDLLARFSQAIKASLLFKGEIIRSGPDFVVMPATLATETLHKLFYIDDFDYEIQECLTCLNPDNFVRTVENILGNNSVFQVRLNSASFSRKYQEHKIVAKDLNGDALSMPLSFVSIVASRNN